VNDVGVDLNKACLFPHLAPLLPFVCGLGFRKAMALRQAVMKSGRVNARKDILTGGFLQPKVTSRFLARDHVKAFVTIGRSGLRYKGCRGLEFQLEN
jgi:hypothetical protein